MQEDELPAWLLRDPDEVQKLFIFEPSGLLFF